VETQRLRCKSNYVALKYAEPIRKLAETLIKRIRDGGPYIALHLRYVPSFVQSLSPTKT